MQAGDRVKHCSRPQRYGRVLAVEPYNGIDTRSYQAHVAWEDGTRTWHLLDDLVPVRQAA